MEPSVDGVLGGFGHVNDADIKGSEAFLKTLLHERLTDCGGDQHLVALGIPSSYTPLVLLLLLLLNILRKN